MIALGHFTDNTGRRVLVWTNPDEFRFGRSPQPAVEPAQPVPYHRPTADHDTTAVWLTTPTSMLLSLIGGVLLLVGLVVGLALAFDLPGAVAAGLPDPSLNTELARLTGYADWPRLAVKLGLILVPVTALLAAVFLVAARRRAGIMHMLRAVLGIGGLIVACVPLGEAFIHTRWTTVVDHINANRIGPAIETFIDPVEGGIAILAAVVFMVSFVVLAWPPRRRIVLPPAAPAEEVER